MAQGPTKGIPIDTDPSMVANSNQLVPSQAAVVSYVTTGNKVLLSSQTVSGVSAVNFTSGFGGYSYYYIEGYEVLATATTGVYGIIQFSYDAGATYNTIGDSTSFMFAINGNIPAVVLPYILVITDASTVATLPSTFTTNIYNLDSNTLSKTTTGSGMNIRDGVGLVHTIFSGVTTVTTTCNALRFKFSNSSNFSGTFRLFGVK